MAKKHKWPHLSCILKVNLQVLLTSAATVLFSAIMRHFDTDHCCEFYILTAFFLHGTGTLRNSERMKSIEWELKIAASFFPNTLQTLSKQVAPTVKPSVLQAIKENENKKKFPNEHCPFFFVLFCLILSSCFSRFLGTLNFWKILLQSSLPPRATAIKTASLWVYARAHTHTHHELVCVLQYDKQKYNTKKACVFPRGVKKLTSGEH